LKPTKQQWNLNPLTKELYYIGIGRRNSTVDSLLAIIGKEGEDVAALFAGQSALKPKQLNLKRKKLLLHLKLQRRKKSTSSSITKRGCCSYYATFK
jgi:hypothetical protein